MDDSCVCVAGAALEARQSHFAWQAQHLEHLRLILRGKCSTWSTSREVCGIQYCGRRLRLRGRHSTWSTSVSCCVAGAALGAPQSHFPWQVQHAELHRGPTIEYRYGKLQRFLLNHLTLLHIYTSPSTHHHLHYIVDTTPSTLHHQTQHHQHTPSTLHRQHITIYITPSTQHHLHNIIHTTPSTLQVQHLEHCHLTPSASFLLMPLLLFYVVACSLFCFVDLFHIWMSEDIVNMWLSGTIIWCSGVSVVSRWCLGGFLVVSWWCRGGVSVVSWCLASFLLVSSSVVSSWCFGGVSVVSLCLRGVSVVSYWWCLGGVSRFVGGLWVVSWWCLGGVRR